MTHTAAAPSLPSTRRRVLLPVVVAALAITAACSDEDRRELGAQDAEESLQGRVQQALAGQGLELDGDLSCAATITSDDVVASSCDGTTTSGAPVTGSYEGTADVSAGAETCAVRLVVLVAAEPVLDEPGVDCFDMG